MAASLYNEILQVINVSNAVVSDSSDYPANA